MESNACFAQVAPRQTVEQTALSQTIAQVEAALNSITTLKARFRQTDRHGRISTGWFFLERPGKVRFDYDAPSPNLILSDGKSLLHIDKELKEYSELPRKNPLHLFLHKRISFQTQETRVRKCIRSTRTITFILSALREPGTLTLVFDAGTLRLQCWILEDEDHNRTIINLERCVYGEKLPTHIFKMIKLPA
jgi:outer membrane lipoprotein-sorting protein